MLTREETLELIRAARSGDLAAREKLVCENVPLVKSIVKRLLCAEVPYEDLFQTGMLGLIKAIDGFDESFGVCFSTYAVPLVLGEIKKYRREQNTVKMARSLCVNRQRVKYSRASESVRLGREPTVEEIAAAASLTCEQVIEALESMTPCASLDSVDEDGTSLADAIAAPQKGSAAEDRISLYDSLNKLEKREKQVILMRYYRNKTQTNVAEMLGISQVQVSRIEARAIGKLRAKMG